MHFELIIPAFIAGFLTFLAPCTLPLVPGYLAFISGVSSKELKDPESLKHVRKKIFINALLYVIGFSIVVILMGTVFSLGGALLSDFRNILTKIAGLFVIIFGLILMGIFRMKFFRNIKLFQGASAGNKLPIFKNLTPGKPTSSFLFGFSFALGWTPCIGPILGSILLIASTSGTVLSGALLLAVFSLGLAIPFLAIALGIGSASKIINKITKHLNKIEFIGGIFIIFLGVLMLTGKFAIWTSYFYTLFEFINYDALLLYL